MKSWTTICLLFLLYFSSNNIYTQQQCLTIRKPTHHGDPYYCGDNQYGKTYSKIHHPLKVKVINEKDQPVKDRKVYYTIVSHPQNTKGQKILIPVAKTNKDGIASTYVRLGSKPGDYYIEAKIKGGCLEDNCLFKLTARPSDWVFKLIIGLLGGLGLFLFGMNLMSSGMQKSAGKRMRSVLSSLTKNKFVGVGIGTFVTFLVQSSSATTVMLVGFVQSGLMKFAQTLGVILGASIGTTITVQIIALKITDFALLFVALGFIIYIISKSEKLKNIGESILGFGILFFGMHIMSTAMHPLRTFEPFLNILVQLENPLLGIVVGLTFTALIQSSGAFIGIMIVLASQGFLTLQSAIPLVFGSNIGTAVTAILASMNANREAKKVALAHTLFKIIGVLIFIWWIPKFAEVVSFISPKSAALTSLDIKQDILPRQIANAHTLFNVALTVIILPFTSLFTRILNFMLPSKTDVEYKPATLRYIKNSFLSTPTLALNMAKQETLSLGYLVISMLRDILPAFLNKDVELLKSIEKKEEKTDFLVDRIKNYVIKITRKEIEKNRVNEAFQIIYTIKELEEIADIIATNMSKHAYKWKDTDIQFSEEGIKELEKYHSVTMRQLIKCISAFSDVNLKEAKKIKTKAKAYRKLAYDLELQHYERLRQNVPESVESSKIHIEIINMLKTITRHASNIARILLER